ncbi:MAG: transglutaminaseTgpA domain-containing protein [Actinomycetota bacterium]
MAREQSDVALSHRLLSVAAVAFLAAAAALAFGRVFRGHPATLKLVGAALLSVGVAALLERRGPILAVIASGIGLVVVAGLFVYPKTTFVIFPTLDTFRAFGHALHQVGEQARTQVAPTAPLQPLMLAGITAVWAAAFAAHALAIRSGSPLLAALPPGSLVAFADILLDDGARPSYAALFLAAALAVLFMDGLRRVRQWGPLRPWNPGGRRRLTSTTATRGARRVTLAALAGALLLPGLLPGFQQPAILKLDTTTVLSHPSINPLVSITATLKQNRPQDLFLIRSQQPSYWRWLSLETFDGARWSTDDIDVEDGRVYRAGTTLPSSSLGGTGLDVRAVDLYQTVQVLDDLPGDPWLPMAFEPQTVAVGQSSIRYDPESASAVPEVGIQQGLTYRVRSRLVLPTRAQLDSVTADQLRSPLYEAYRELPSDTPPEIFALAQRLAKDHLTPFAQILAIQTFLRSNFRYDQHVSGASDIVSLQQFLTVTRRGFCQQFATAMAVLVRALGYPSRVAVGFTPGRYDRKERGWRVSTTNAHAWVEVLFPGFGWMAFEPTPTRDNPVADTYLAPQQQPPSICELQGTCGPGSTAHGQQTGKLGQQGALVGRELGQPSGQGGDLRLGEPAASRAGGRPYRLPLLLVGLALLALLAIAALLLPIVKMVIRQARVRRGGPPRELVLSTYRSFASSAADLGLARAIGETLREYRERLRREIRSSLDHLQRLMAIADRAAYSPAPISANEAKDAVVAARQALREMRRATPLRRRLFGIFRPGL